jgi:hypothetical protein
VAVIQTEKTNLEANIVDIQNQLGNANEKIQSFKIAWENLMK